MTKILTPRTKEQYEQLAQQYHDSLEPEDFMQSNWQTTQNEIASLAGRHLRLRGVDISHCYDMLIQYFCEGNLRRVVPDVFFVKGDIGTEYRGSWSPELEEDHPLLMTMEMVAPKTRDKDYKDSFNKYERELKVPYYLLIDRERDVMVLHHLVGGDYVVVAANSAGRFAMPEIEVEVGWLDGWVRFWHRGDLLPITTELAQQLTKKDELIEKKDAQITEQQQQLTTMNALVLALRPQVETRARQANRQDILAQLPTTTNTADLLRWLAELG